METTVVDTSVHKHIHTITAQQIQQLLQITQQQNPRVAFDTLIKRYLQLEVDFWKQQNETYEKRWLMSFDEFAAVHETWENGQSMDIIAQYQDWETAYYSLRSFETILNAIK